MLHETCVTDVCNGFLRLNRFCSVFFLSNGKIQKVSTVHNIYSLRLVLTRNMLKSTTDVTPEMQGVIAQEVNDRMGRAVNELQAKYAAGKGGTDASVDGPTGDAYKKEQARKLKEKKEREARLAVDEEDGGRDRNIDLDDENEDDMDDDYELRRLREKRLKEIKNAELQRLENIGKGHGQYREIVQDEFLSEVTNSLHVVCHFYHKEFPKCKIMDMHMQKIATRHVETKFVSINAEKAPFFVEKLRIRTMPTLVFFEDGVATGKLIGFEGLADDMPEGMEDEWPTIRLSRYLAVSRMINPALIVDDDAEKHAVQATLEERRKQAFVGVVDDDDFDINNLSDEDM